ncbi:MAG: prepilin peptidase [Planctomycetia bacterium]|nr:prepilin peptidase [Planctomycetia bacterium]
MDSDQAFTYLPIIYTCFVAILGACFGSFLNVVIWRVPEKMNLSYPPSHCPKCNAPIRAYDNIPIVSWLLLRGKCRSCHASISVRYPLVETFSFLCALIVALAVICFGWNGSSYSALAWDGYSDFVTTWSLSVSHDPLGINRSYVESQHLRLLAQSVGLSLTYMALLDAVLMLGFVLYDKNRVPGALLITSVVILLASFLYVLYLNNFSLNRLTKLLALSLLSGCAVPALFYRTTPRAIFLTKLTLGALVGVLLGAFTSFPILLACELLARVFQRKVHKNLYGVTVALLSLATLVIVTFEYVLQRNFAPVFLSAYGS